VLVNKSKAFKSNKFSGNLIVQYNIWLKGNKKLRKNIKKQNMNAKKDLLPESLNFSFCLNPPLVFKWYFAFRLDKFSNINNENINNNNKKDIRLAKAKSSKVIQELYIPVVNVLIEKKSTAPNSAKVSMATKDKPATIAGLAAGKIIL